MSIKLLQYINHIKFIMSTGKGNMQLKLLAHHVCSLKHLWLQVNCNLACQHTFLTLIIQTPAIYNLTSQTIGPILSLMPAASDPWS